MKTIQDTQNPISSDKPTNKLGRGILAIFVGVIVDMGGTNLISVIYTFIIIIPKASELVSQGFSPLEMQSYLLNDISKLSETPFMVVSGLLFSLLGGYSAGLIAKDREILYAILVGVLILLVSTACGVGLRYPGLFSSLWLLALTVISLGVNGLGGYIAWLQKSRKVKSSAF